MDFFNAMGGNLSGLLVTVISFLVVLTVVVFVHEMGHFLVGRWCGVGVHAFSIGFGPELFGYTDRHGIRWKLCAVPLGGYVKFVGDANGASVPDPEAIARMDPHERAISFPTQPLWKRVAIVAAGPIANFLLAIAIYAAIFSVSGRREVPPIIGHVQESSPALAAGFKPGDVVQSIDGSPITSFEQITRSIEPNAGVPMRFTVLRDGQPVEIDATPAVKEEKTRFGTVRVGRMGLGSPKIPPVVGGLTAKGAGEVGGLVVGDRFVSVDGTTIDSFQQLQAIVAEKPGKTLSVEVERGDITKHLELTPETIKDESSVKPATFGRLGVEPAPDPSWSRIVRYGPVEAVWLGVKECYFIVARTFDYLGKLVSGRESADQLSGPIGIARVSGEVAKIGGPTGLIPLVALLSVSIGLINLFPIPILDGGHLLFYAFEAVRGRPLSERTQEIGFRIGLALVLMLMLFATKNDVFREIANYLAKGT